MVCLFSLVHFIFFGFFCALAAIIKVFTDENDFLKFFLKKNFSVNLILIKGSHFCIACGAKLSFASVFKVN